MAQKNSIFVDRQTIRKEYEKVWANRPDMVDYCTKKTAAAVALPSGEIVTVDKQSIETRFCFGENGYDYEDAVNAAAHARRDEEYFIEQNMKAYREWIRELREILDGGYHRTLAIREWGYLSQPKDCRLVSERIVLTTSVLAGLGGSARLSDLPGEKVTVYGEEVRIATPLEVKIVLAAYEEAARLHEQKVRAYLKRYGLSKVCAWTYWSEA